jgi:hypothetical protein
VYQASSRLKTHSVVDTHPVKTVVLLTNLFANILGVLVQEEGRAQLYPFLWAEISPEFCLRLISPMPWVDVFRKGRSKQIYAHVNMSLLQFIVESSISPESDHPNAFAHSTFFNSLKMIKIGL